MEQSLVNIEGVGGAKGGEGGRGVEFSRPRILI
jgi:hypothetical protein